MMDTYSVGDTIHIQFPRGWSAHGVRSYKVVKLTPGGQIVARLNDHEIRVNKRGVIIGGNRSELVVSDERAKEIREEVRRDNVWLQISGAVADLGKAARAQDRETALELVSVIEARLNGEAAHV